MILFFLVITFIIDICIMFFSATRKDSSRSVYFVLLAAALSVYTSGNMLFELGSTADGIMNALRMARVEIPLLAPCFLLVSLCLFQQKSIKSWMLPAVGIYGLLMFFLILFNDNHHLYYGNIIVETAPDNSVYISIERNILFWVQEGIALLCMVSAYIVLIERYITGNRKLRSRIIYVITGALVVFIANVINVSGLIPGELDLMPFVMTAALILLTVNIAKHKLLDICVTASGTALKAMENAMIIMDRDWCFLSCNDSAKALFPSLESFSQTEPISKVQDWPRELEATDKLSEIVFELDSKTAPDSKSTYRANTNKIADERGTHVGWSIIIHDITGITFLINQLETLAATDPLTGVSNRRGFLEKIERELELSAHLNTSNALIMYDLDFFRKVNETYGHDGGDHTLCAVVEIVKKQLRQYDIIGRYGGEEFLIFIPASKEEVLYTIASRLCKEIESTEIIYKGRRIPVTASFGAVQMPPGSDFNEAMLAVDEALYEAKHNGRNQVVIGTIKKKDESDRYITDRRNK